MDRNPGLQRDHAGDVRGVRGSADVADDHLVDRLRVDLGSFDRLAHGDPAELHGVHAVNRRERLDEGRARAGDDQDIVVAHPLSESRLIP